MPHAPIGSVGRDHLDPALGEPRIERIAVVRPVAQHPLRKLAHEALRERRVDERHLVLGLALEIVAAIGVPCASLTIMILVPLPRFVLPTSGPPFCTRKRAVDRRLPQVEPAAREQLLAQRERDPLEVPLACHSWKRRWQV